MTDLEIDKAYMEAMEDLQKLECAMYEHNRNVVSQVGGTANEDMEKLLDGCAITGRIEVANKPLGENQHDKTGVFTEVWVDQWSVGMEGDSFEGFIYAKYDEDKWLKIPYSC